LHIPLILGTDVTDNGDYIGAVIGWKHDIAKFHADTCNVLRVNKVHMVRIDNKADAFTALSNASTSIRLYCLKAEMPSHRQLLLAKKGDRTPKHVLWNHLNYCTGIEIKRAIQPALTFFNQQFGVLVVEADGDAERILKPMGVKVMHPALAHQIADMVAWFNHANKLPKSVTEVDISQSILSRLKKRLNF
jgi:hypothetical protein